MARPAQVVSAGRNGYHDELQYPRVFLRRLFKKAQALGVEQSNLRYRRKRGQDQGKVMFKTSREDISKLCPSLTSAARNHLLKF